MFILIQSALYIAFLFLDIAGQLSMLSSLLKFASICLCYLAVDREKTEIKRIMALTVAADFLLVLTPFYAAGVTFFIAVQLEYYFYITGKSRLGHLSLTVAAGFCASLLINFFIAPIAFIVFLASVYFFTLVTNILLCLRRAKASQEHAFLALCFTLILCCDIHVGVTNVLSAGVWYNFGQIAMWMFYLPSQVFITLLYSTSSQSLPYPRQTQ